MTLLNVKIDKQKKEKIKELIQHSEYKTISEFVRNTIDEKIGILEMNNKTEEIEAPDWIPDGKYYAIVKEAIVGVGDTISSLAQEVGSKFPYEKITMKRKNKKFPKIEYAFSATSTEKNCWKYSTFDENTYPIIPVYILQNKQRIYINTIPDSAASLTLIKQEIIDSFKLKPLDMQEFQTASGISKSPIYQIDLEIINQIHTIKVISVPISAELPFQGLIGRNVLDFFNLYLLGKNQVICLK